MKVGCGMGEVHQLITEQGKLAALAGEHDCCEFRSIVITDSV
jgi:hypothetical protein